PAGTQATAMMKAIQDLGVRQAGINVVSTQDLVPDEELPNIGNAGIGIITAGNYSVAADRPANKAFLEAWRKAYGDKATPDFFSVDGWDGLAMVYDMLKETKGKFTGDEAMKFFSHWKTDASPRGPISIDPNTRDIVQNIYIRKTEMKDGKLANVEFDVIPNVKDPWKELNPRK
ncbi:MAG TPA: ABC transporter substrate-binding protein, partial [Stellaceae bacterium]|nr:ABC transporter substrate-binding protein [Stellaceae bacterium]